jgi:hypothetical protein
MRSSLLRQGSEGLLRARFVFGWKNEAMLPRLELPLMRIAEFVSGGRRSHSGEPNRDHRTVAPARLRPPFEDRPFWLGP